MGTLQAPKPIEIRNILLATDFDPITESALHYSLAIARRYGAKIFLVHVVRTENRSALDDAWRDAHRHMTDLLIGGHLQGVAHQVMVEQGEVWPVLSRNLTDLHIDILVIGTHGRGRIGKLLLGSVAEEIFRQATCPVMMVGPNAARPAGEGVERVLFCTGFSAHSLHAGAYALSLAQRQSAELVLLHVIPEEPASPPERERVREAAKARLLGLIPPDANLPLPPMAIVEYGNAAERILSTATELKPTLIVMGVRQPIGFARRLKWATAYAVVSEASCPVLTVRSPDTSSPQ